MTHGGKRAGAGRKKGVQNKNTALLRDAIIGAAEQVGDNGKDGLQGYCRFLAVEEPKAFATLLGKVLPTQVTDGDGGPLKVVIQRFTDADTPTE